MTHPDFSHDPDSKSSDLSHDFSNNLSKKETPQTHSIQHLTQQGTDSKKTSSPHSRDPIIDPEHQSFTFLLKQSIYIGMFWGFIDLAIEFILLAISKQWNETLTQLSGYMVAGLILGICITFWFIWNKIRNTLSFAWRAIGFTVSFYIFLSACAFGFHWVIPNNSKQWISFTITYLIATAIAITGTWFWEKKYRKNYQAQLRKYRLLQQQNKEKLDKLSNNALDDVSDDISEVTEISDVASDPDVSDKTTSSTTSRKD